MSYPPPSGGYGPPTPGGFGGPPPPPEPPKNYLVHNILGIFGCTVIGIIGLVFALQVNSKWQSGDYSGAQDAAKIAKILGIIGLVSFILMVVFVVVYVLFFVVIFGVAVSTTPTY